ncbi:ladinin-1 isoform X2 [Stigmatopora argus]
MSVNRRNWSTLSSLARQWTVEDEEEVERERRRRVKSSSGCDTEDDFNAAPQSPSKQESPHESFQDSTSTEEMQVDFMEILRVRDEKRQLRRTESLRRQKGVGEEDECCNRGASSEELTVEQCKPITESHLPQMSTALISSSHHENGEPREKNSISKQPSNPACKFVSSVSISLDKSPSTSGPSTPVSPISPMNPRSAREQWTSPCNSPSSLAPRIPMPNGHAPQTYVISSTTNNKSEPTTTPVFKRKSSRTISFRMMRKAEEESSPLQRSASVRVASKKFDFDKNGPPKEDKEPSFQRNSTQRVSSRSIREKMEKLAQAAQKSEISRSSDVGQHSFYLVDEVSKKRGLFEKELQGATPIKPSNSCPISGTSIQVNPWLSKTKQIGSNSSPTELKHVDISTKRSLFENRSLENDTNSRIGKIYK